MNYRFAQVSDVPALCRLENAQPRAAHWGEAGWRTEIADASSCIVCAQKGNEIVGFVALRLAAGVGEILNVAVAPLYCRRGVGQQLLSRALSWVREHGGGEVTLEVGNANSPAIRLYQKVGFVQVGVRKNFYNGNEDALILKLKV